MAYYSVMNEVYISKFPKVNPPVRSCVECPLNVPVVLDALAYKNGSNAGHNKAHERHTLHVQSISHWAPANVGPYSQAIRVSTQFFNPIKRYFQPCCLELCECCTLIDLKVIFLLS